MLFIQSLEIVPKGRDCFFPARRCKEFGSANLVAVVLQADIVVAVEYPESVKKEFPLASLSVGETSNVL